MKKTVKFKIAVLCTAILFIICTVSSVFSISAKSYDEYIADVSKKDAVAEVKILGNQLTVSGGKLDIKAEHLGASDVCFWDGNGSLNASIAVPTSAYYRIELNYLLPNAGVDPEIGLKIDGNYPFDGAKVITLKRIWENNGNITTDSLGNELAPEQVPAQQYVTEVLRDKSGQLNEPYRFYLTEGTHTVSIENIKQQIIVASLSIIPPTTLATYKAPTGDIKTDTDPIIIEGEAATLKSVNTIVPKSDTADASMTPSSHYLTKLNYIGGTAWQNPAEEIIWSFTAKKDGYYKLGFRYKQSEVVNGESIRSLKIDGKVPFSEAENLRFGYDPDWKFYEFGGKEPYYIYLDEGEHTLSLSVTLGETSEYYSRLSDIVEGLGDQYISIVRITGDTPDVNRDYELFAQIPDLNDNLKDYSKKLSNLANDLKSFTGERGNQYMAAINNMKRVLDIM